MIKYLIFLIFFTISVSAQEVGELSFQLTLKGEVITHPLFSFFVMPNEVMEVKSKTRIEFNSKELTLATLDNFSYTLKSPSSPGVYKAVFSQGEKEIVINVLVMTPMIEKKGEYLNGYRVGNYPSRLLNNDPIYKKPLGLFEINDSNKNLQLTPHLNIQQFVCKQAGGYPKYLIIRERLLLKLEYMIDIVRYKGIDIDTFGFISGYRTPFYNKSIGNVPYSRHVWGGAADIFIDQDKNGQMDDLNGDGEIDERDVRFFYNLVEGEFKKEAYNKFIGGLGFYRKNSRHNGFIHVDVRGNRARW